MNTLTLTHRQKPGILPHPSRVEGSSPDLPVAAFLPNLPEMWTFPQTHSWSSAPCSRLPIPLLPSFSSGAGHAEALAGRLAGRPLSWVAGALDC